VNPSAGLLASVFAVYLAAVASPGPNTFVVTRLALADGRRSASLAVLGVAAGNLLWLAVTLGGTHVLFERAPGLARAIRIGGGIYLGWLGLRVLAAAVRGGDILTPAAERPAPGSSFRTGFLTSLTNPNTFPFYVSLLGATVAATVPVWVRFAAAGGVLLLCILWYGGLAWGFSAPKVQRAYQSWSRAVNLLLAGLLLLFGVKLLVGW
jgi:threonine/homoserine/homoserine lactone efflux protein